MAEKGSRETDALQGSGLAHAARSGNENPCISMTWPLSVILGAFKTACPEGARAKEESCEQDVRGDSKCSVKLPRFSAIRTFGVTASYVLKAYT